MFGRVLVVTLTQVLRSVAVVLLPTSFIALIAWATAGSATGNTGDPLRAALWIWLGAHQIPFSLKIPPGDIPGLLSYLPLGAIAIPVLTIRSGIARVFDRLDSDVSLLPMARILFALIYTSIGTIFAFFAASKIILPKWYLAPFFLLPITLISIATVGRRLIFGPALLYGTRIICLLLGIASLVLAISLVTNIEQMKNLTIALEPGVFGGLLLLILNILYIPNAVVATLGYFSGTGFAIGSESIISPISFHLDLIPAFPLLAAVPAQSYPFAMFGIAIVIFSGALLTVWTIALSTRVLIQSLAASILTCAVIAVAASGALITDAMSAVGVSPWKFTVSIGVELIIGALLGFYAPRISRR